MEHNYEKRFYPTDRRLLTTTLKRIMSKLSNKPQKAIEDLDKTVKVTIKEANDLALFHCKSRAPLFETSNIPYDDRGRVESLERAQNVIGSSDSDPLEYIKAYAYLVMMDYYTNCDLSINLI